MSSKNTVVNFSRNNAVANVNKAGSALKRAKATGTAVAQAAFLKMGKDGIWTYGAEGTEVEEGALWALNPASFRHGWINWRDDPKKVERLGELMVSVFDEPNLPDRPADLEGGKWSEQWAVAVICVSGEDEGTELEYSVNSKSGISELRDRIAGLVGDKMEAEEPCVPIVELLSDSYKHKTYGKIYTPELKITRWSEMGSDDVDEADKAEEKSGRKATKPKATRRTKAEEPANEEGSEPETIEGNAEEVTEDEAPRRRRRRPAPS